MGKITIAAAAALPYNRLMTHAVPNGATPLFADALASMDTSMIETPTIITCTIEGLVELSDLGSLFGLGEAPQGGDSGSREPSVVVTPNLIADEVFDISRIRERHHSVARLIASGMPQGTVAEITRYTDAYISTLIRAPAMKELIGHYKARHDHAAAAVTERLVTLGMSATDVLQERISNAPQDVTNQELIAAAKLGLDRAGHGPSSTTNVREENHIIDYAELRKLNDAARANEEDFITVSAVKEIAHEAP